jgi:hypothetical protein|tara:strand:+ start:1564 stop:1779 length:216 start_codon:yes stop_codon:yes gene_type:complete
MQALAIFKNKELAPVSYIANIRGRGIKHIQTLAYRFADEHGFNYSHITYYKHRGEYPTIAAKLSTPYFKEV